MWNYPEHFDVIVVGGGHAGCEAALASARMGASTLLLTMNLDTIAKMSCNPAVGGIGKGHMVREIDALGGEMGKVTDCTAIQFRMLNASKGPSVWAPRAQADKVAYQFEMKHRLEKTQNLYIKQGTIEELVVIGGKATGVLTKEGIHYSGSAIVLSAGTFMQGLLHIGETNFAGGRAGDAPSVGLSASLVRHGLQLGRLKTGTPPRVNRRSIDFSQAEVQHGDPGVQFSYDDEGRTRLEQVPCHIVYTNERTKEVILKNLHRSPMYSGKIKSIGPRYCPSIEDKMVRFSDKERHQLFLEPEGLNTEEIYVNGISSSLPFDVQLEMIQTIFPKAEITRPAYAIEYDYVLSGQIDQTLETRTVQGLFLAGQINGTTGYEEAAGQGFLAGVNAAAKVKGVSPLVLDRSEAYLGVMIDDLVTKGVDEPYRMFTSRAEHRLLLRQDNADLRLRHYGYKLGLIDEARWTKLLEKQERIEKGVHQLEKKFIQEGGKGITLGQYLCRPEVTYNELHARYPNDVPDFGGEINFQIELSIKYKGYIDRQKIEVKKLEHIEKIRIPKEFDFAAVIGLRFEARAKLQKHLPESLGQASRISGVSPADISILMCALKKHDYAKKA